MGRSAITRLTPFKRDNADSTDLNIIFLKCKSITLIYMFFMSTLNKIPTPNIGTGVVLKILYWSAIKNFFSNKICGFEVFMRSLWEQ